MIVLLMSIALLLCLIVILVGCLDCLFKKKRFEAFGIRDTTHARHNAAFSVDIFDTANASDQVIIEPLPDILSKVSSVPVLRPRITCIQRGRQDATLSHISVQRSFPRDHLTYLNEIGSGWFGKAIESEAVEIGTANYKSRVIVKMLKDDASKQEQKQFMDEVFAFRCLEHTNVIRLLGQCTEATPYLVILEFAAHGNLKSYLVQHNQEVNTLVSTNRLVKFALDAASGLACLHRHDYIHNDIAARNFLIMADYTLKLGDYGISDYLFKDEYYNTGTELLPVRWMAPETLVQTDDGVWSSHKCSKVSDMWSFGILLWEICSLGERPYDTYADESVLQAVVLERLVLPSDVTTKLPFKIKMWSVMIQCWQEPSQRLDIEQAHSILEHLSKTQLVPAITFSNFDQKWNHLEPNQGKISVTESNTSRAVLASNFTTVGSSSPPYKPLAFTEDDETSSATNSDIVIDIDNSAASTIRNLEDDPHLVVDFNNFSHGDPTVFQSQLSLENELVKSSASSAETTPKGLLTHHVETTISVSQGPSSTSQFYSPHSSPSSEYMTASETNVVSSIQEDAAQGFSILDRNLDSAEAFFNEFIDETMQNSSQDSSGRMNNNNIAAKIEPSSCTDDDDFSEFIHKFSADFTSIVRAGSDSFLHVEQVMQVGDQEASTVRDNGKPTTDIHSDNLFPDSFASADTQASEDNDKIEINKCLTSDSSKESTDINSFSITSNTAAFYGSPVEDTIGEGLSARSDIQPYDLLSSPSFSETNTHHDDVATDLSHPVTGPVGVDIMNETTPSTMQVFPDGFEAKDNDYQNTNHLPIENAFPESSLPIIEFDSSVTDKINGDLHENSGLAESSHISQNCLPDIMNVTEENRRNVFAIPDDSSLTFKSFEFLDQKSSKLTQEAEPVLKLNNGDDKAGADHDQVVISWEESQIAESGNLQYGDIDSLANSASSMRGIDHNPGIDHIDSPNLDPYINLTYSSFPLSDTLMHSSDGATVENNDQETRPMGCGSGLYRCRPINLTEDIQEIVQSPEDLTDVINHEKNEPEDSQSVGDSDDGSSITSEDMPDFVSGNPPGNLPDCISNMNTSNVTDCNGIDQSNLDQPHLSLPNIKSSQESAPHCGPSISPPGDFDEYALQLASEIYLSRGLKSPRVFEIPPLETIPEHHPMPSYPEEPTPTPSDSSSMDVRYDELFGTDSYEWDDFYGDSLIGRDSNHQKASQPHPLLREFELTDWAMDMDSVSIASTTSQQSRQSEEVPHNFSPEQLDPSHTDMHADLENVHHISASESFSSTSVKNHSPPKETLVSSLLSKVHSSIVHNKSSVDKKDFYSLTEMDEDADLFSDGLASPPVAIASATESFSSLGHLPSQPPLQDSSLNFSSPLSDAEVPLHQNDFVLPAHPNHNLDSDI